ncbi:MAG: hypothetical protein ACI4U3_08995 [Traorella sp.]
MKACQLKISLLPDKKITRTLLISKNKTIENLHEMIQILFNLDGCESYSFKIKDKILQKDLNHSEKKTLLRIKENETFYYYYDLVDTLSFEIKVLESVQSNHVPQCISYKGKNLYEGVYHQVESQYQSNVDINWINHCLSYYEKNDSFMDEVKEQLTQLTKIRFFQDYMHNQIVKIKLPQDRIVYMGCDASDDVVLNFHINANKLIEYSGINPQAFTQSIIKYHDCIECSLIKRSKIDSSEDFDLNIGPFGVFISYANVFSNEQIPIEYMGIYVEALKKYVQVIQYCHENNIKYTSGKMISIDENSIVQTEGKMNIYNIQFLDDTALEELKTKYPLTNSSVEIDVLTLPIGEDQLETRVIVGDEEHGFQDSLIFNGSIKTLLVEILLLLEERWKKYGMDQQWILRDLQLCHELEKFTSYLGVEVLYQNHLPGLDQKYFLNNLEKEWENASPDEIILRILDELGIDINEIKKVEISKEDLEKKIQSIKNQKKYN